MNTCHCVIHSGPLWLSRLPVLYNKLRAIGQWILWLGQFGGFHDHLTRRVPLDPKSTEDTFTTPLRSQLLLKPYVLTDCSVTIFPRVISGRFEM